MIVATIFSSVFCAEDILERNASFGGSKMALTTKSGIRYEGILHHIDLEQSTVSLRNVKSLGTKDGKIPRNDDVFNFAIFKRSDISRLDVIVKEEMLDKM